MATEADLVRRDSGDAVHPRRVRGAARFTGATTSGEHRALPWVVRATSEGPGQAAAATDATTAARDREACEARGGVSQVSMDGVGGVVVQGVWGRCARLSALWDGDDAADCGVESAADGTGGSWAREFLGEWRYPALKGREAHRDST